MLCLIDNTKVIDNPIQCIFLTTFFKKNFKKKEAALSRSLLSYHKPQIIKPLCVLAIALSDGPVRPLIPFMGNNLAALLGFLHSLARVPSHRPVPVVDFRGDKGHYPGLVFLPCLGAVHPVPKPYRFNMDMEGPGQGLAVRVAP